MKPLAIALALLALAGTSCSKKETAPVAEPAEAVPGGDGRMPFRQATRQLYNNREFAKLDALADDLRSKKSKFEDGSWKISHFYEALECRDDEPESMWQLHQTIHRDWEKSLPGSVTAKIARADFLTSYAWQARGSGFADKVTEEGWKLFQERLGEARKVLEDCEAAAKHHPRWASVRLRVALGEGIPETDYRALFETAKATEPAFYDYDLQLAHYLLPRWHGRPGDWEAAAEAEIARPGGLGHETYARVVQSQVGYYGNLFKETKVSWPKTRQGFEEMEKRYPGSKVNLNAFCRMACLAGDRLEARKLFAAIGADFATGSWRGEKEFQSAKAWAEKE